MTRTKIVAMIAALNMPSPEAMPIPATIQMLAAVVNPLTILATESIAPAPMNPMPTKILAAMREMSHFHPCLAMLTEMIVNKAVAIPAMALVRMPVGR